MREKAKRSEEKARESRQLKVLNISEQSKFVLRSIFDKQNDSLI